MPTDQPRKIRWFQPTPGHLLLVLLAAEGILFLELVSMDSKGLGGFNRRGGGGRVFHRNALVVRSGTCLSVAVSIHDSVALIADRGGCGPVFVVGRGGEKGKGAAGSV